MSLKVLIADDAHDVAQVVAFGVRMVWPGCEVTIAPDGQAALACFAQDAFDLVVLDVSMPPPDGFAVCQSIRTVSQVPILMLTVRDTALDKVRALDLGADDYLTKPFDHVELLARLRALVRRAHMSHPNGMAREQADTLTHGELTLNHVTREVRLAGALVPLTRTEYRLLEELLRDAGTVLSHRQLLERVWGPAYANDTHYLKVFVQRLRRKLGDDPQRPHYIRTEWGHGYSFEPLTNDHGTHTRT
jgi:two-component system, OmpR family, KDP operon response regulator KdpE